jgi:hypothetical protein
MAGGFFDRDSRQFAVFFFVAEQPSSNRTDLFTWGLTRSKTYMRDMIEHKD